MQIETAVETRMDPGPRYCAEFPKIKKEKGDDTDTLDKPQDVIIDLVQNIKREPESFPFSIDKNENRSEVELHKNFDIIEDLIQLVNIKQENCEIKQEEECFEEKQSDVSINEKNVLNDNLNEDDRFNVDSKEGCVGMHLIKNIKCEIDEPEIGVIWNETAVNGADPLALPNLETYVESKSTEIEETNTAGIAPNTSRKNGDRFLCENCGSEFSTNGQHKKHIKQCRPKRKSLRTNCRENKSYKKNECDYTSPKLKVKNQKEKRSYKCRECGYSLANANSRRIHEMLHTGLKPYKCTECDFAAAVKYTLIYHKRTHTGEKPYKCKICNFTCAHSLKTHMMVHNGDKPYKCRKCDLSFTILSKLKRHEKVHTGIKPYKCKECGYSFLEANMLKVHMRIHTGEKPYKCTICNYASSYSIKNHMKVHTGEKSYKCRECDSVFASASGRLRHEKGHTGVKPFKCEKCNKSFTNFCSLKSHLIAAHTEKKPYKCKECDYATAYPSALYAHNKRHSEYKLYKCNNCDYSTPSIKLLARHMRVHRGEKLYKCKECDSVFTNASVYLQHKKGHTKVKPYNCEECGMVFLRFCSLKSHLITHTSKKTI